MNTIRRAVIGDLAGLMQLLRCLQRESRMANPESLTETLVRRSLFGPAALARVLVADTGVSIAAFVIYAPTFSVYRAGPAMQIDAIYVKDVYRRLGIGKALARAVVSECKAEAISGITWFAARSQSGEQEMLARLGVRPHDNLRFVRLQVSQFDRLGVPALGAWQQQTG